VDICLLKNDKDQFAGTGFLEFATPEATKAALALHGSECAGRPIILHYAKARKPKEERKLNEGLIAQPQRPRPEHCTVVFVGNLRFDIDTKVVKAWAAECGEVTGIRWLNDRHTKKFKGCGYIEFGAKSAETAVDAIVKRNGDMLMGRPVRVDYAENTRVAGEGNMDEEAEAAAPKQAAAADSKDSNADAKADGGGDGSSSSSSSSSDDSSSDSDSD
jgi:RNA recognition motif-containing protein